MSAVHAVGIKNKNKITVDISLIENNAYNIKISEPKYKKEIEYILKAPIVVGGTYFVPDFSMLKIYFAIEKFFDSVNKIDIDGEIEQIPMDGGPEAVY